MSLSEVQIIRNRVDGYIAAISSCRENKSALTATDIDVGILPNFRIKHVGKVRDSYICDDYIVVVTTDRQSAFDRQLASVPFKGQVLNQTSQWWFEKTSHLVPNHLIACPHPNVTIGHRCSVFTVEFVVRGYITGTTNTSMWTNYEKGVRNYCGHLLPDGLKKNQKLTENLLTPTTKDDAHDELTSAEEIISTGRMSASDWEECSRHALSLFSIGQRLAADRGLILVDTKYEFGKDKGGNIRLVDEIQTPDSSRYWLADSYESKFSEGLVSHVYY